MEDLGLIPELGRSCGEVIGYPLWYSGLKNSMDSPSACKVLDTTDSGFHFHFQLDKRDTSRLREFHPHFWDRMAWDVASPSHKTIDMNVGMFSHYQSKVWEKKRKKKKLGRTSFVNSEEGEEKKICHFQFIFSCCLGTSSLPICYPLTYIIRACQSHTEVNWKPSNSQ